MSQCHSDSVQRGATATSPTVERLLQLIVRLRDTVEAQAAEIRNLRQAAAEHSAAAHSPLASSTRMEGDGEHNAPLLLSGSPKYESPDSQFGSLSASVDFTGPSSPDVAASRHGRATFGDLSSSRASDKVRHASTQVPFRTWDAAAVQCDIIDRQEGARGAADVAPTARVAAPLPLSVKHFDPSSGRALEPAGKRSAAARSPVSKGPAASSPGGSRLGISSSPNQVNAQTMPAANVSHRTPSHSPSRLPKATTAGRSASGATSGVPRSSPMAAAKSPSPAAGKGPAVATTGLFSKRGRATPVTATAASPVASATPVGSVTIERTPPPAAPRTTTRSPQRLPARRTASLGGGAASPSVVKPKPITDERFANHSRRRATTGAGPRSVSKGGPSATAETAAGGGGAPGVVGPWEANNSPAIDAPRRHPMVEEAPQQGAVPASSPGGGEGGAAPSATRSDLRSVRVEVAAFRSQLQAIRESLVRDSSAAVVSARAGGAPPVVVESSPLAP